MVEDKKGVRMVLNLGAGNKLLPGAINVDVMPGKGINKVVDLNVFPWPWEDNSVNYIHASHIMEHFPNQEWFLAECIRILKPGGRLRIVSPHASCIPSVGCLGHYRTYSYSTFHDYLSKPWYMFKEPKFKTIKNKLNWWYELSGNNIPSWANVFLVGLDCIISPIINISPRVYENFFAGILPCREVIWVGEKL